MMGKAGAEKRPSQSLALHCSDRCAVQKEKDKDSIQRQMYNIQGQKRRIKRQVYTTQRQQQYTKTGVGTHNTPYTKTGIKQRQMNDTWLQKRCLQRQVHNKLNTKTGIIQR